MVIEKLNACSLDLSNDSFHLDSSPPFNVPLPEVEFERLAAVSTALGSIAGSQQSQEQLGNYHFQRFISFECIVELCGRHN